MHLYERGSGGKLHPQLHREAVRSKFMDHKTEIHSTEKVVKEDSGRRRGKENEIKKNKKNEHLG